MCRCAPQVQQDTRPTTTSWRLAADVVAQLCEQSHWGNISVAKKMTEVAEATGVLPPEQIGNKDGHIHGFGHSTRH